MDWKLGYLGLKQLPLPQDVQGDVQEAIRAITTLIA